MLPNRQPLERYADAIGQWAIPLIASIAFKAIFGTVIDGYARLIRESIPLLQAARRWSLGPRTLWIRSSVESAADRAVVRRPAAHHAQLRHGQRPRHRPDLHLTELQPDPAAQDAVDRARAFEEVSIIAPLATAPKCLDPP